MKYEGGGGAHEGDKLYVWTGEGVVTGCKSKDRGRSN